jgi:hypothetical protein
MAKAVAFDEIKLEDPRENTGAQPLRSGRRAG